MFALAELLLRSGGRVSGCDLRDSRNLRELEDRGGRIWRGHDTDHLDDAVALVVTAALPADHPEVVAARKRGIPVLKRARALGSWVNEGRVVAVAGTHGKTTTTALATEMLAAAGLDPTGVVGGRVSGWSGNLRFGASDLFVVEADEYDRSFHALTPDVAVVTNLEADHLEVYGDLAGVESAFGRFVDQVRDGGWLVACADDPGAARLLHGRGARPYTYGTAAGSMLRAVDVAADPDGVRCTVVEEGAEVGQLRLRMGGLHNLRNALGAAAAARRVGAGWDAIRTAAASFAGVGRRFQRLGELRGVLVVDDYAHHPTEIEAALTAARAAYPGRRLVVAFQPHLYSRTRDFADDFGAAVAAADLAWVTDVFPAREEPIAGVTGRLVADAAADAGGAEVRYHPELDGLAEAICAELDTGDVVVTLGAGSVESLGPELLRRMEGQHA
jgi:UDP-N-acetylmuramate--alanine ligase